MGNVKETSRKREGNKEEQLETRRKRGGNTTETRRKQGGNEKETRRKREGNNKGQKTRNLEDHPSTLNHFAHPPIPTHGQTWSSTWPTMKKQTPKRTTTQVTKNALLLRYPLLKLFNYI